ncbi:MAG: hypothetical protein AAF206_25010, partial [Bacteroidota bacterium]
AFILWNVLLYFLLSALSLGVSLWIDQTYLVGLLVLVASGIGSLVLWIMASILSVRKYLNSRHSGELVGEMAQGIFLLMVPLAIFIWIQGQTFKIGG